MTQFLHSYIMQDPTQGRVLPTSGLVVIRVKTVPIGSHT